MIFTATQLERMRQTATETLPDTCTIQRENWIDDGSGGSYRDPNNPWATTATVACEVSPAGSTPAERVAADAVQEESAWTITMPAGTEVATTDSIVDGSGRRFAVVRAFERSREITLRVMCRKVV